jgi:hypothetical protein
MSIDMQRPLRLLVFAALLGALLAACGSAGEEEPLGESQPSPLAAGAAQATTIPATAGVELAPELVGLEDWINSEPLTLAQLRGEPVLIVFWASW